MERRTKEQTKKRESQVPELSTLILAREEPDHYLQNLLKTDLHPTQ